MECPGSVKLNEMMPNETSIFAEEGTLAHELAESILRRTPLPTHDLEMLGYVQVYTDHVRDCYAESSHPFGKLYIEAKVNIPHIDSRLFGTVDAMFYDTQKRTLYVFDLKYGKGKSVDVEGNRQLMYYALGAREQFVTPPREICMTIVQPRIEGEQIKSTWYTNQDLDTFEKELKLALFEVDQNPDFCNPSQDACQWCNAKAICPALKDQFELITGTAPTALDPELPNVDIMTNDELAIIFANMSVLTGWLKAVHTRCFQKAKDGMPVPGTKLVEQRKNRVVRNQKEAIKFLQRKRYKGKRLKLDDIMEPRKLKSPAKLEAMKKIPKEDIEVIAFKPEGQIVLAKDTDKRETKRVGMDPIED
jgi:hypothetical protein